MGMKEIIQRYIGGEFEIEDFRNDLVYRGPIRSAEVDDDDVIIEFDWLARNDGGYRNYSASWTLVENKEFRFNLKHCQFGFPGEGNFGIRHIDGDDLLIFTPQSGRKLSQSCVKGLQQIG